MRILMIGDGQSANLKSWRSGLETYGGAEVRIWTMSRGRVPLLKYLMIPGFIRELDAEIKSFKPDILIAYRYTSYGYLGSLSGFHPFVVAGQGESDVWPPEGLLSSLKAWMARKALSKADLVHAWAGHMTASMLKYGAPAERILVLPRGVDRNIFWPPDKEPGTDRIALVVTRSLFPEYRHEVLIQALSILRQRNLRAKMHILGDGPLRAGLQKLCLSLGLGGDVEWHGQLQAPKVAEVLRSSNIYLSVPVTEGLSSSLLEAMACGCYPIVSDLPANRDLIRDGVNGRLVPVDDPVFLADAIEAAASDVKARRIASGINRDVVETSASLKENMQRFMTEYRRLAAANQEAELS